MSVKDDDLRRDVKAELRAEAEEMLGDERLRVRKYEYDIFRRLKLKPHGGVSPYRITKPDVRRSHIGKFQRMKTIASTGLERERKLQRDARKKIKIRYPTVPRWKLVKGRITKKTRKAPGRKWLGPYPNPISDYLIINVELSEQGKNLVALGRILPSFFNAEKISAKLRKMFLNIKREMIAWINQVVPKDTGTLRETLIYSISEGGKDPYSFAPPAGGTKKPDEFRVLMILSAGQIPYAGILEKMNTDPPSYYVRHTGKPWEISRKTGRKLYDPKARHDYRLYLIGQARRIAKKHYKAFLNSIKPPYAWSWSGYSQEYKKLMGQWFGKRNIPGIGRPQLIFRTRPSHIRG